MAGKKGARKGAKAAEAAGGAAAAKYAVSNETEGERKLRDLKYVLYQRAVQSPKGDISYLVRFFMDYVGGRTPLHLHEDFCGAALICTEWLRADPRRTAVGLDLDLEALEWGQRENLSQLPDSARGRALLLLGNVLNSLTSARVVSSSVAEGEARIPACRVECSGAPSGSQSELSAPEHGEGHARLVEQAPDLVCAFNFSVCCLQSRADVLRYFRGVVGRFRQQPGAQPAEKQAGAASATAAAAGEAAGGTANGVMPSDPRAGNSGVAGLAEEANGPTPAARASAKSAGSRRKGKGGVFAMDLYGGTSSECALKIQRKYGDFDYTWEQEHFDAVTRTTRISLHFRIKDGEDSLGPEGDGCDSRRKGGRRKKRGAVRRVIKSAFSYQWRLWTIPEVRECMFEAGFDDVRVWMRKTGDARGQEENRGKESDNDSGGQENEGRSRPESDGSDDDVGFDVPMDARNPFKEVSSFLQCDSWNAYVVGICK